MESLRQARPVQAYVSRFCAWRTDFIRSFGSSSNGTQHRHHFEDKAKINFDERQFLIWLSC